MDKHIDMSLKRWKRDWALMSVFFNGDEIALITEKTRHLKINNVVYCSFENRFAKAGGLASVATNILPYLKEANSIPEVLLMTPFYPEIMDQSKLVSTGKTFNLTFFNKAVKVGIYEYKLKYDSPVKGIIKEYYLKAEGFFNTNKKLRNPYVYYEVDRQLNDRAMNENALFFCKAVPFALKALGIKKDIVFHLNEWQTALIALTSKEAMVNRVLESCASVQTIHNSYDAPLFRELLRMTEDESRRQNIAGFPGEGLTAYQIGLQLVDAPVTTVSSNFARELTTDIIQTKYYAPHLQNILKKNPPAGINNGTFVDFSSEFPKRERHTVDEMRRIKLKNRKALLKTLSTYKPEGFFGELTYRGRTINKLPDKVPVIAMSGRLDPVQKGYDIILKAVEKFSEDEIKLVLTPLPVHKSDLDYFYEIACKCRGNVIVFPGRMDKGYHELQTGSTFGIMPSIYEPFGASVEYMSRGTVNIGRSTGGLIDQIDDECGFLFKEDAVFYTLENVQDFTESEDIVQMRKKNPWVQSMAENLNTVLKKAIDIYQNHPDEYYRMILNGFKKAKDFNWENNAKQYYRVYQMINRA
jgi:glycogen synthase